MADQIVWVDIPVKDLDRAIKFYSALLGAPVKKEQFPQMAIGILPHNEGKSAVASSRATATSLRPRVR